MNILQRGNFSSPAVQSKALSKQDENLPIRNINLKEYGTTQSIHTLAIAWVRIYNLRAPMCTIVPPLNLAYYNHYSNNALGRGKSHSKMTL